VASAQLAIADLDFAVAKVRMPRGSALDLPRETIDASRQRQQATRMSRLSL
jgi:hypothetical protein